MQFTPVQKSEIDKERAAYGLWPVGEYAFEVVAEANLGQSGMTFYTVEKISSNQNEMIQLLLKVTNANGFTRIIIDYLLPSNPVKFHDACVSCGLDYFSGNIGASDFIGKRGRIKLGIQKDSRTGEDRNGVKDYLAPQVTNGAGFQVPADHASVAQPVSVQEDEIPF